MPPTYALELTGITKRITDAQGAVVLDDVALAVLPGEIHVLLGEDGSGKTTLFKILAGLHPTGTYAGEIRVAGRPASLRSPQDAIRCGIGIVPRRPGVFSRMSIAENVTLSRWQAGGGFLLRRAAMEREAQAILAQLDLKLDPAAPASHLTPGQQRLLMIGRALAGEPTVVVLDEPAAYLTSAGEQSHLIRAVRGLAERNIGCLYLARRPAEAALIADRVTVLRDGRLNGSWPRAELDESTLAQATLSQRAGGSFYEDRDEPDEPRGILGALRSLIGYGRDKD